MAKAAIARYGEPGMTVLRHLHNHGKLAFGTYNPPLPTGFNGARTREMLSLLVNEQLVTVNITDRRMGEYTYEIAPGMISFMDELLYA